MSRRSPTPEELARNISASAPGNGEDRPARVAEWREYGLRIARDGTWYHQGAPIARIALVKLFATVLKRAPDGTYLLETPVEKGRIEVEDVPFVAVELDAQGTGREQVLKLRTNLDETVVVGPENAIRIAPDPETGHPVPYVHVRDGLEARITRPVYYQLVELGMEATDGGDHIYGVWSNGEFFELGALEETG